MSDKLLRLEDSLRNNTSVSINGGNIINGDSPLNQNSHYSSRSYSNDHGSESALLEDCDRDFVTKPVVTRPTLGDKRNSTATGSSSSGIGTMPGGSNRTGSNIVALSGFEKDKFPLTSREGVKQSKMPVVTQGTSFLNCSLIIFFTN
ncbi:hypothetical protein Smp_172870 [Schistosoma mansoni]|uniref:hypothetical protein n=1 Tax=Schistosoma mansoni TaxID=6183 RepID=UPI00022DCBF4|nr:hypothetical protein Smp_172870 [Schistosoma mansoni]|eukprot:XP_018654281.1 hypothetical protein Smp_172870 [Schistosoma mansoni]